MIPKTLHLTLLLGLFFLISCGDEEPQSGQSPDQQLRSDLTAEAAKNLDSATAHLLSLLPEPASIATSDLSSFSDQFKNLTARAAEIGKISTSQKTTTWDPALGKFHAASRALLENPDTSPESIAAIRSLMEEITELDRALTPASQ